MNTLQIIVMLFALQRSADEALSIAPDISQWRVLETKREFTGPRGGVYHFSASGRKVYQRHKTAINP